MMIHIIEIKAVRPINIRRLPFSGTVLKMGYEVFHDVVQLFHGLFCYYEFIIHIFHSDPSVRSLRPAICPPLSVFLIVLVLHPARSAVVSSISGRMERLDNFRLYARKFWHPYFLQPVLNFDCGDAFKFAPERAFLV